MKTQKIAITGTPGSGKTTLSIILSKRLNLPLYHLDRYLFLPGGIKRDKDAFRDLQKDFVIKPKWIIEGCGTTSLELRYSQADLVLYLNVSRLTCLWRTLKRFIFEKNKHPDTPDGCTKVFTLELIRYIWSFSRKKGPGIYELHHKYPNTSFLELRSKKEIKAFLKTVKDLF